MRAAQIAVAILAVALIAAGTILLIFEETTAGWVNLVFGWVSWLLMVSMVAADARQTPE